MTIEEKVGQCVSTTPVSQRRERDYSDAKMIAESKKLIDKGVGQLGVVARHSTPRGSTEIVNAVQKYALEKTRLGIPVLIQDECVHGCKGAGSTMFPMSIGLAASWNPGLMERITHAIAKETRARGIRQAFSPTLNIARDVRCGRTEETYGEDPYLLTRIGLAFIKTLQKHGIASTPKHFAANFVGDGGRDSHAVHFSERILREIYFPAFKAAVREGRCMSLMIAHTAIDGIPCSLNPWLMDDIVRKEWGFKGFIVPDNTDVQKNHIVHFQSDSYASSSLQCIEAGLDTDLAWTYGIKDAARLCYLDALPRLVKSGKLPERIIDRSVTRILRIKFMLGLFENPYQDPAVAARLAQCPEHRALALEAARQSIVLLKNDRSFLPLAAKKLKTVAVIGPNAAVARLGGYTCSDAREISPLDGIKARLGGRAKVLYAKGCGLMDGDTSGFPAAVRAAKKADAVILCMGNSSDKIVGQPETTEGERHDRHNLDLPGVQEQLIDAVLAANPNVVVLLQNGSAITMRRWAGRVKAIVEAWYAGAECGPAVADVLFGDYNPGGKLPITFPFHSGQLPLYYNPRPHGRAPDYVDLRGSQAQFPFGHGISYTSFAYSGLKLIRSGRGRKVKVLVSCAVTNTGRRAGDEVVQLYLRDRFSTITRPIMELRGFERVSLAPGETRTVSFVLGFDDFAYLDRKLKPVLEPGHFDLMIGSSSADIRLRGSVKL
jgi:beta-glucosidase